jgi:hypothetical protein
MKFAHGFRYERYDIKDYDEEKADFKGFWFARAGSDIAKSYSDKGSVEFTLDDDFDNSLPTLYFHVNCTDYVTEKGFIDYCNADPDFGIDFSDVENPDDEDERSYYEFISMYFDNIKAAGYEVIYCEENDQDSWCFVNPQKYITK